MWGGMDEGMWGKGWGGCGEGWMKGCGEGVGECKGGGGEGGGGYRPLEYRGVVSVHYTGEAGR